MLRAYYYPSHADPVGLLQEVGTIFIGYTEQAREEGHQGEIAVKLTRDAHGLRPTYFASLRVHHDGVSILRELEERGFISRFEEIRAGSFYDMMQCLAVAGVPLTCYDNDDEMMPRKLYEMLVEAQPA